MPMRLYRGGNAATHFLIHLFILQTVGRLLLHATLPLLRLLGMPAPLRQWHSLPHHEQWLSTALLLIALAWSLTRILRRARRRSAPPRAKE